MAQLPNNGMKWKALWGRAWVRWILGYVLVLACGVGLVYYLSLIHISFLRASKWRQALHTPSSSKLMPGRVSGMVHFLQYFIPMLPSDDGALCRLMPYNVLYPIRPACTSHTSRSSHWSKSRTVDGGRRRTFSVTWRSRGGLASEAAKNSSGVTPR